MFEAAEFRPVVRHSWILLRLANKIAGIVRAASPGVDGHLWIRAQRPRHIDAAIVDSSRYDPVRSHTGFPPPLQRSDRRKPVRAGTAAAMRHSRYHEKPQPFFLPRAHTRQHALVIRNAVQRRNGSAAPAVIPAVIDEELAAARLEHG